MANRLISFRGIVELAAAIGCIAILLTGCSGRQFGHILKSSDQDMVGSHAAGAATYNDLVKLSVEKLLARQCEVADLMDGGKVSGKRICFVGIENQSVEELGDFKDQLFEEIDTAISSATEFDSISPVYVKKGLQTSHLNATDLFLPDQMASFSAVMGKMGQPIDYLLFAKITSGTTERNRQTQRDYTMSLELVDVNTGRRQKESTKVRKGYHKSRLGKWLQY